MMQHDARYMGELRVVLAERVPLSVNDTEAKITAARAARRAEDAAAEAAYLNDDDNERDHWKFKSRDEMNK